jgi:hypothetical protein
MNRVTNPFYQTIVFGLVIFIIIISTSISLCSNSIYSLDIGIGIYHPFSKPSADLDIDDQFDLKNGLSVTANLFRKSFWHSWPHRTSFGLGYEVFRGVAAQQGVKTKAIPDRIYHAVSLCYIVQVSLINTGTSILFVDVAGRLSFLFYDDVGCETKQCGDGVFCIYPFPSLGFQAGVAYLYKLKENFGIKAGLRFQLQTGIIPRHTQFRKV